jgi:hypothetical protein
MTIELLHEIAAKAQQAVEDAIRYDHPLGGKTSGDGVRMKLGSITRPEGEPPQDFDDGRSPWTGQ